MKQNKKILLSFLALILIISVSSCNRSLYKDLTKIQIESSMLMMKPENIKKLEQRRKPILYNYLKELSCKKTDTIYIIEGIDEVSDGYYCDLANNDTSICFHISYNNKKKVAITSEYTNFWPCYIQLLSLNDYELIRNIPETHISGGYHFITFTWIYKNEKGIIIKSLTRNQFGCNFNLP